GPINVNRVFKFRVSPAAVNSASQINLSESLSRSSGPNLDFVVTPFENANDTVTPPIRLAVGPAQTDYGTWFDTGLSHNSRVTLSGVISSAPGMTTPIRITSPETNTSGFNLTNANTFTGNISVLGYLGINSDASLGNA